LSQGFDPASYPTKGRHSAPLTVNRDASSSQADPRPDVGAEFDDCWRSVISASKDRYGVMPALYGDPATRATTSGSGEHGLQHFASTLLGHAIE